MAQRVEEHPLAAAYEALLAHGLDGAGEALRILVNEVSKMERAEYLGAGPYERHAARRDHANGFKPKTVLSRVGEVTFDVPQVRGGGFYPSALERGSRTEQALNLALAGMYVQGVSTRRVVDVLQRLLGPEIAIASTQVSRIAATLDEGLAALARAALGSHPVSAARRPPRARARGRTPRGLRGAGGRGHRSRRQAARAGRVGGAVGGRGALARLPRPPSQARRARRAADRGRRPCGPQSGAPGGVPERAVAARCQFHLQHNAQAYVPRLEQRAPVARQLLAIFNAPDRAEAQRLLASTVTQWRADMPKLADWAEVNVPESFAVFEPPAAHRTRLRTTNGLERINRELKRRTRVAPLFPNAASCLRLVSALLTEFDEEWMTGKIYLTMNP